MASNNIPELIKIGSIDSNMTQDIETAIQEPVVQDESTIRFSIHKRGFIHSNSKLILSLNPSGEANHYLPLNVGIGSLIKNVAFRIGDTTIQEVQDWGELHAYRSLFVSGEVQREKEQFLSQRAINLDVNYESAPVIGAKVHQLADGEVVKVARSVFGGLRVGSAGAYTTIFPARTLGDDEYHLQPFQDLNNAPTYQISLQDLVPFFKQNQLPAWVIQPDIYIDITLQDGIYRTCTSVDGQAATSHTINKTETKLIIDHIFYPGDVMEAWRNANKKVQFTYFDYRISKMSLTTTELTTGLVRNLGGAGRIVTKVISGLFDENEDTNDVVNTQKLLNKYGSIGAIRGTAAAAGTAQGRVTSNLKYNDHFLYPVDRVLSSVHFYDVTQSEGVVPFVSRDFYGGESRTTSTTKFMGRNQKSPFHGLRGRFFFQSWRLNRSERISSRGIELYQTYNQVQALKAATDTYTLKVWLEVLKYATLEDGVMTCYFA
tara:strand:+ start:833 stop:2296 length:1464 start_codon:yes stop_codon:yes gene_type:complete